MATQKTDNRIRVFISYSSANIKAARQVEDALHDSGLDPWLDQSDIRVGVLLRKELQRAIEESQVMVLMWSKPAAASRWVAAELLTAFHVDRFIVPCVLSDVELPQFLSRSVYVTLRGNRAAALEKLGDQVKRAPRARNEFPEITSYETKELGECINQIYEEQEKILDRLAPERFDLPAAMKLQTQLDPRIRAAEKRWRYDPTILNLAGYHRKNQYMLRHWDEYCAGRFPEDPVLREGEKLFFETLFVNSNDCGALNGLGNILFFEGELDAAEFFVRRAIDCAEKEGIQYPDAVHDLKVIRGRKRAPELGRARTVGKAGTGDER